MSLQYVQNTSGETTAVLIPIEDWERLKNKYPDIEKEDPELPDWQKDMIDSRLFDIKKNPELLKPGDELLRELDSEEE